MFQSLFNLADSLSFVIIHVHYIYDPGGVDPLIGGKERDFVLNGSRIRRTGAACAWGMMLQLCCDRQSPKRIVKE